jgi:hypothetical protein
MEADEIMTVSTLTRLLNQSRILLLLAMAAGPLMPQCAIAKPRPVKTPKQPALTSEEKALKSFREKASNLQVFLSSRPIAYFVSDYAKSPTGVVFKSEKFTESRVSFDVMRTSSVVTPFVGHIDISYKTDGDAKCGDVTDGKDPVGYSTMVLALQRSDKCFQPSTSPGGAIYSWIDGRLIFAYQDGKWVFKDGIRPLYGTTEHTLLRAFGQIGLKLHQNQAWEAALLH